MEKNTKRVIVFIALFIVLILISNVFLRFITPLKPLKVNSKSMAPTFNQGDVLFYAAAKSYNLNQVIVYRVEGIPYLIAHRIVNVTTNEGITHFSTKGDGNRALLKYEGDISPDQILGKVVFSTNSMLFYTLLYGLEIIIAILLTWLITSRIKQ